MRNTRIVGGAVLAIVAIASVSLAGLPPGGTFVDDNGHVFEPAIEAVAAEGITKGCNPPDNDRFCPDDPVTRGQMAAFLVRARGYTDAGDGNLFTDDDSSVFESAIDKLGTAGVTKGCNPPDNTKFCPDDNVTRGQMAAFLVRALGYTEVGDGNLFSDDDGHLFEMAIDKLGTAGVTKGCNPPVNDKFCPDDLVTRGQMAAFLVRALGLDPIVPPPPETTTTAAPTTTTTTPPPNAATVRVNDDFFSAPDITIATGGTVTWTWAGTNPHSTKADGGGWDSPVKTTPTSDFVQSAPFTTPGVFAYFCEVHGAAGGIGMAGTVTVVDP